jgi:hypothetical protein
VVTISTTIRNLRLSKMSASAPAGIANRQIGSVLAAATRATIKGSGLRLVISQPLAALYIQPPTLETSVAVQITVKAGWRNGATKDGAWSCGPFAAPLISPAYARAGGSFRLRRS